MRTIPAEKRLTAFALILSGFLLAILLALGVAMKMYPRTVGIFVGAGIGAALGYGLNRLRVESGPYEDDEPEPNSAGDGEPSESRD